MLSEGLTESLNVQEIKFGDNDTLSAITSSMVHADYLFLLTDVDGLYSSNPRKDPDAKFLEVVSSVAEARLEGREPAKTLLFVVLSPSSVCFRTSFHQPLLSLILFFIIQQIERNQTDCQINPPLAGVFVPSASS